jgi:hypothetical protein
MVVILVILIVILTGETINSSVLHLVRNYNEHFREKYLFHAKTSTLYLSSEIFSKMFVASSSLHCLISAMILIKHVFTDIPNLFELPHVQKISSLSSKVKS